MQAVRREERGAPATSARRVASDFAAILAGRVGSVALSLATAAVTTRLLLPAEYGRVAYLTTVATLIFVGGSTWTISSVVRYGREAYDEYGSMRSVSSERLLVTAPTILVASLIAVLLHAIGFMPQGFGRDLLWLAIAYGVLLALSDHVVYTLQAVGRMGLSAWPTVVRQAAIVVTLGLLWALDVGVTATVVAWTILGAWLVVTAATAGPVWRVALWPPVFDPRLRRRLLRFSIPLFAVTVSQYVIATVDVLVLGVFRGTRDVGIYSVAYQAFIALQTLGTASSSVLTPLFVSSTRAGTRVVATYVERVLGAAAFAVCAAVALFAPFVGVAIRVAFGGAFGGAARPLAILLVGAALFAVASLQAPVTLLFEETRAVARVNLVAAAVNVVGDVVLVGVVGMGGTGAAVATTVTFVVVVAGYQRILGRHLATPPWWQLVLALVPLAIGVGAGAADVSASAAAAASGGVAITVLAVARSGVLFDARDAARLADAGFSPAVAKVVRLVGWLARAPRR